jgi:hypothetical protein
MKNWIDKKLEDSFIEFEKQNEVEGDIVATHDSKKEDGFKNFNVKSLYDLILKKFYFGKL